MPVFLVALDMVIARWCLMTGEWGMEKNKRVGLVSNEKARGNGSPAPLGGAWLLDFVPFSFPFCHLAFLLSSVTSRHEPLAQRHSLPGCFLLSALSCLVSTYPRGKLTARAVPLPI